MFADHLDVPVGMTPPDIDIQFVSPLPTRTIMVISTRRRCNGVARVNKPFDCFLPNAHGRARLAKHSIGDDMKVKIASVHSDFICGIHRPNDHASWFASVSRSISDQSLP